MTNHTHVSLHSTSIGVARSIQCHAILRQWAESHTEDATSAQLSSFRQGCHTIDLFLMAKRQLLTMQSASDAIRNSVQQWLALHKAAYGESHLTPKFHWVFDVAEQMKMDSMLHDQFVVKRLHLIVKKHGERIDNLRIFSRSVLAGCLNTQIAELRQMKKFVRLVQTETATFNGAQIADSMEVLGMHLSVDDLVVKDNFLGAILACAMEDDQPLLVVALFQCRSRTSYYSASWIRTCERRVWRAEEVKQATTMNRTYMIHCI